MLPGVSRAASERAPLPRRFWLLIGALCALVGACATIPVGLFPVLAPTNAVRAASAAFERAPAASTADRPRGYVTAARPRLDRDALSAELDDDDRDDDLEDRGAPRTALAGKRAVPPRGDRLTIRGPRELRGHPQFDPSRFATGSGLLRGPPTSPS